MNDRANRRQYLQLLGAGLTVGAAGCTDSGDNNTANGDDSETDDGNTDDGGGDDGTSDDNDENSDDGTGDTDDGDDTDDSTDDDDDDGQTDGDDEDSAPQLAEVFSWTDSYVMEIDAPDFEGTWRFNDGNWQLTATTDGQTSETYSIRTDSGRETYVVTGGQCYKTESANVDEEQFDPQEPADDTQQYVASGRTTIDGEEVYEFDVEDGVYYLSVETGYPVRYEAADGAVVQFRSWGDTEPITPPDMECFER